MVIELQPSSPDGFYHKGFALFQLHDYAAAVSRPARMRDPRRGRGGAGGGLGGGGDCAK
jgi:hypothetical protein